MQHPPCFFTISNRLLLGGNCVKEKKYLDFLGGLVLLMLSVIIIIASVLMHIKSGEVFYLSPGLMPMILGIALLFCRKSEGRWLFSTYLRNKRMVSCRCF